MIIRALTHLSRLHPVPAFICCVVPLKLHALVLMCMFRMVRWIIGNVQKILHARMLIYGVDQAPNVGYLALKKAHAMD